MQLPPRAGSEGGPAEVLVVDDSPTLRRLISALLQKNGLRPVEVGDAEAALDRLSRDPPDLMITDWMMPGLSGIDLVRRLRAREAATGGFTYTILLTARADLADLSEAMAAGADDFLTKPVYETELMARLNAGRRLVAMQRDLAERTESVTAAYNSLRTMHDLMERDLRMAGSFMAAAFPPRLTQYGLVTVAAACLPCDHVGGDLVGHFQAGPDCIGAFAIDVSGHGVASGLYAMSLARLFDRVDALSNIATAIGIDGLPVPRDPAEVVAGLNARCLDGGHDLYFTMALATLDLATGEGRICRAGHPEPLLVGASGSVRRICEGGPPVGLLPDMSWPTERFRLAPGERLVLHSDGITEARGADGRMIETEGVARLLAGTAGLGAGETLDRLLGAIGGTGGRNGFDDDVSALIIGRAASAQGSASPDSAATEVSSRKPRRATATG